MRVDIPFSLANSFGPLRWREALWAFERELVSLQFLLDMAAEQVRNAEGYDQLIVELCWLQQDDMREILRLSKEVAQTEPSGDPDDRVRRWLRISLLWLEHSWYQLDHPIGYLEHIASTLYYPDEIAEINRHVAGMAAARFPDAAAKASSEKAFQELLQQHIQRLGYLTG